MRDPLAKPQLTQGADLWNEPLTLPERPLPKPLIVEKDGARFAVVALTDIDGTVIDETIPERERLATIGPAVEATRCLQTEHSIPVGIITGRSFGEANFFRRSLGGCGPVICEDGAVLVVPSLEKANFVAGETDWHDARELADGTALILSAVGLLKIRAFLSHVESLMRAADPGAATELISTFSPPEVLKEKLKFRTIEDARASADRLASAFVVAPSDLQRTILEREAPVWGIRTFAPNLPHFIGQDAEKGKAIRTLCRQAARFVPDDGSVSGIVPIFFGNNTNDVAPLKLVGELNGKGVIVGHPKGGYFVDEKVLPPAVLRSPKPYGYGILDAIPEIMGWIKSNFKPG